MTDNTPTVGVNTVPVKTDAKNRAFRTGLVMFGLDVAIILVPGLIDVLAHTDAWGSSVYWTTVGVSVGKTILGILLTYLLRLKKAPVGADTPPEPGQIDEPPTPRGYESYP